MEVDCEYCDCAENGSPKILDTHGGSMSSAIACHQMGFDLTLCELDKDYYEAGVKRFKEQTMQQSLFK
jgi:site-specific DNA-methyltransferase (adenine-specific)